MQIAEAMKCFNIYSFITLVLKDWMEYVDIPIPACIVETAHTTLLSQIRIFFIKRIFLWSIIQLIKTYKNIRLLKSYK